MAKKTEIEVKCEKCGKAQPKNKNMSNGNFDVFDCNEKCECGGKFVTYINGQKAW